MTIRKIALPVLAAGLTALLGGCAGGSPAARLAAYGPAPALDADCAKVLDEARGLSERASLARGLPRLPVTEQDGIAIVPWAEPAGDDTSPEARELAYEMLALVGRASERQCAMGFRPIQADVRPGRRPGARR